VIGRLAQATANEGPRAERPDTLTTLRRNETNAPQHDVQAVAAAAQAFAEKLRVKVHGLAA
jgi:hypothetical protein